MQEHRSSGPAAPPFFKDWIAFLISCLVGLPQLMGSSVSAGDIPGQSSGSVKEFTEVLHPSL